MWAANYWPGPRATPQGYWNVDYWPKTGGAGATPGGGGRTGQYLPIMGVGVWLLACVTTMLNR